MTRYVFDTNIVSYIVRRDIDVIARLRNTITAVDIVIGCPVVWYEIKRGLLAKDARSQMSRFRALFETFNWQDLQQSDWAEAADFWATRRRAGQGVDDADLPIAAFVHNRNAVLITDNEKDFTDLNISIQNWKRP